MNFCQCGSYRFFGMEGLLCRPWNECKHLGLFCGPEEPDLCVSITHGLGVRPQSAGAVFSWPKPGDGSVLM